MPSLELLDPGQPYPSRNTRLRAQDPLSSALWGQRQSGTTRILIEALRGPAPTWPPGKLVCYLILPTVAPPNFYAAWAEAGAHKT